MNTFGDTPTTIHLYPMSTQVVVTPLPSQMDSSVMDQQSTDMTPAYGRQLFAEKWPEALNAARTQVLKYIPTTSFSSSIYVGSER